MNVTTTGTGPGRAPRATLSACALLLLAQPFAPAFAGPNEQAKRIYERIAGVPPSAAELASMANTICGGTCAAGAAGAAAGSASLVQAAAVATNAPTFYNVTLKNFAMPWTNRAGTVFSPLNDSVATVIGMVRDGVPFNTALSADILYTSNASGLPAPSPANNNHYATAEQNGVNLMATLVQGTQSGVYGTPSGGVAGLFTTRGLASAFFVNGTNRAMFRFTMINQFCADMPALADTTRPTDFVRQDVARSPGGNSMIFMDTCVGCHSGMDGMAKAFAYYNFDAVNTQSMLYTPGQVQPKYLINAANFVYGYVTPDDNWVNHWRQGPNTVLGWSAALPGSGSGAASLGQELESSSTFAQCQVTKVFQAVCFRAPVSSTDLATVSSITSSFTSGGYNLKQVFQQAAAACPGS
ncbi:MAG TPA: hypothetical protein VEH00_04800 [Steroidobacteraceae bacterium]|nr:hypothetical protein [Steroidobacteraceae bacterium]